MGKNEKAYLNVEYVRRGDLSNEIFVKVKVKNHVEEVLSAIKEL